LIAAALLAAAVTLLEPSVVTHHSVHLATGATLPYTATAGTLTLRNDRNEPTANVFYVAYTTGDKRRPVTFLYNGGPGSASLWLHVGAFGPRRIVTSENGTVPPSGGHVVDNPSTLLDTSDLVFIDPVGTGYSSLAGKGENKDFWGVDEDIAEFDQFIRRWVAVNDRASSPKYLLGESYGTFRSAGLVDRLQKDGMPFNGVILLSSLLNYADDFGNPGDENVPDAFAIPSEAAVAWYHKKVPEAPADLATFLTAARRFTTEEYLPAILRPMAPDSEAQTRLAARLHSFIGLDADELLRENLRISTARFQSALLRANGEVTGRYDGRVAAKASEGRRGQADPSYDSVAPAFLSAFTAYARTELNWATDRSYAVLPSTVVNNWNFRRSGFFGRVLAPTVIPDLRDAMQKNPNLRVFAGNGLFDLATPFYTTEYELANVGLDPTVRSRITLATYPSGHMIYLSDEALRALRTDLGKFYTNSIQLTASTSTLGRLPSKDSPSARREF
jgi:carboxypeptidase C (cathepsin A)